MDETALTESDVLDETQTADYQDQDTPAADEPEAQAADDEYFLDVGDGRTRYRTREEAIRGFQEAGKRIAQLASWEKSLKPFGIRDPNTVAQLLVELAERRRREAEGAMPEGQSAAGDGTKTQSDDDLSPKEQAALKWLQKMAPRLGYVPKAELEKTVSALARKIEALEGYKQQSDEARFNSLVQTGRAQLRDLLKSQGLPVDNDPKNPQGKQFFRMIEAAVRDYIDDDEHPERIEAFYAGGEALNRLINAAYKEAIEASIGLVRTQQSTKSAKEKNNVVNRNPKPLGLQGAVVKKGAGGAGGGDKTPQKKVPFSPDAHNRAWEMFQSVISGDTEQ